jgi:SAM-dependent methyltransferase
MEREFYSEYFELEDRHWWFLGRRAIFMRILDRYLAPPPRDRRRELLDVGCGTGAMLGVLERYGRAQGIDADADAVAFCHQRGALHVGHVETLPLPFADGSIDLVTGFDVLEHIDDDAAMLAEIHRVLRPGGQLLVSVPAFQFLWGPQDEISHHRRRYVAAQLGDRIEAAGLLVQRLSYFNTLLFPGIAAIRIARPARPGAALKSDFTLSRPGPLNAVLARIFAAEAALLARRDLPFGVSILALAAKPSDRVSAPGHTGAAPPPS